MNGSKTCQAEQIFCLILWAEIVKFFMRDGPLTGWQTFCLGPGMMVYRSNKRSMNSLCTLLLFVIWSIWAAARGRIYLQLFWKIRAKREKKRGAIQNTSKYTAKPNIARVISCAPNSIAVIKSSGKISLREKGLVWLTVQGVVYHGRKPRQQELQRAQEKLREASGASYHIHR